MCGEQGKSFMPWSWRAGSPPRVRGTVGQPFQGFRRHGITPACAGNSFHQSHKRGAVQDHPRVCGEQAFSQLCAGGGEGSPPRVRGTGAHTVPSNVSSGITPACAGNSKFEQFAPLSKRDHPRVCGEQYQMLLKLYVVLGSPPRVRGTVSWPTQTVLPHRITPACAGNRD